MQTHFEDNKSEELILFLNGWGMDARPFLMMKSSRDILYVYDYTFLDLDFDFSKYKKIILLAYSAGVFMAGYLKDRLPKCDLKIAVNGTLGLFDPKLGLAEHSLDLMENVSLENYMELRKNLIPNESHLKKFNKFQPMRDIDGSLNELAALKKYAKKKVEFEFDKVITGKNDEIISYENQKRSWYGHKNTREITGGHFLFYNFNNFDELVEF